MTDQSGAFPETLREAALWEALKTYGQHRVGCPHPSCPDCRTHTMAASKTPGYSYCTRCGRGSIPTSDEACDCGFEAALERPRPAPPEPTFADNGGLIGALQDIAYQARYDRSHAMLGGPTDPFEYYERISRTALAAAACPALRPEHSPPVMGLYFYEVIGNACGWRIAKRVGTGSSVGVGQLDDGFSEASVEAVVNALNGRGGAAQPPPSAPEPEPLDDICLKPPPGPERDAKTRVVIPLTEYRALIEENKRLRGSEPGPWSVRNFAADREPNGDWNIVANNGALRWCAAHLATEAEANEIRDALNRLAAVSGVPREETNPHE